MRLYVLATLIAGFSSLSAAAELTNADLNASCSKKTLVYNKAGEHVGDKIGDYCTGYLQATFTALLNSAKCNKDPDQNGEFLLSVYQGYIKEQNVSASAGASKTLTQAFRRAADCK